MGRKHKMRLEAAFGINEEGIVDVPNKNSMTWEWLYLSTDVALLGFKAIN